MKRIPVFLSALTLLVWAAARHRATAERDVLRMERIKEDLYVIYGNGGNTAVYLASDAALIVDSKFEEDGPEIVARVKSLTTRPIRFLVNTHHHTDHSHGNPAFPGETEIVAHENARRNLVRLDPQYWRAHERGLPRRLLKDRAELFNANDRVDVVHFGRGHTDGDVVVFFPRIKAAHLGDLFVHRAIPGIDAQAGGSAREFGVVMEKIAAYKDIETYIPGHGEVADRAKFMAYVQMWRELSAAAARAVKEKKSPEDFLKDLKLEVCSGWRGHPEQLKENAALLYAELQAEAQAKGKKRKR